MLISNGAYKLALMMEGERVRLGGRLAFLLCNEYKVDEIFQDKVKSLSDPVEISCLFKYSDDYDKAENEGGYEVTITGTATFSKKELGEVGVIIKEGDYVKIENGLRDDSLDDEENFDDYDTYVIKKIRPKVMENQNLDRIISYECDLTDLSSRDFDDEL